MLDDVVGAYGSRFLLAAGGVGLALLLLILVLWVIRRRAPSPFVRGGRNRQPRLQVLDAAAVDTRRRLVLVRRDDVEHLIMIGGPSDIVIESRILPGAGQQPESADRPQPVEQRPISAARPETPPVSPARAPVAVPVPVAAPAAARIEPAAEPSFSAPISPEPRPRPEPPAPPVVAPPVATSPLPANPVTAPLSAERDIPAPPAPPQPRPPERPVASPIAQPASFHDTASAAEILDAARQRVLPQQRIEPEISAPSFQGTPAAARAAPGTAEDDATAQPAAAIRGDFQRVLEEEMANNLTAERIVPVPANQPPRQAIPQPQPGNLPRRDPDLAPITGADTELQKEVARIFGEMSVNRDK